MAPNDRSPRLRDYDAKRDFERTPEPPGAASASAAPDGLRFVVQRHRASRLHYDLRLELDGTLLSWAVPKGPTLDPGARRLAVEVEDHPIEYADFEGVIPAGEYGGGDVIVWDRGTWQPADGADPRRQLADGSLHFDVEAEKLRGRFVLVRKGRGDGGGKPQWLLLHKRDDDAVEGWDPEEHPRSVLSGRTNDQVAAEPDLVWHSDRPADEAAEVTDSGRRRVGFEAVDERALRALDGLGPDGTWELQGRALKVTNLDKVLFPGRDDDAAPVTKRELLAYHARIAPWMLPYLHDRPVNMHRYPNGAGAKGFWQKAVPAGAPDWLTQWRNEAADEGETECYAVLDGAPSLVWAANLAAFELHPWTSTADRPDRPSWALIDVDPGPETTPEELLLLVRLHRTALQHLDVAACPKTSGRRGFQIWIPVEQRYTFAETREWVEALSKAIGRTVPELVSWKWQKEDRGGLARLDYTQNAINKTLVAPFSVRPAPGAPVSMPITWDELDDPALTSHRWTVRTALERLEERGDPLADLIGRPQVLPKL
ncbi:ATP-dependent DNA ligase [Acidimicrobiia bacterium EGI L10123]|uniref:DNA polymerase domain-containing protein n=1 Tax=Salinilacustrithrix flava TaxID=2957203 RepID=UPI003D7C1721|nr:ATP-dependent DNA ligase [Acidimicrobiia bacterium EGI L10123]